jgi:flagellar biosynthesis/type III secretory pathway protein FliH
MPVPAAARLIEFRTVPKPETRTGLQTFTRPVPTALPPVPVDREAERLAEAFARGRNEGLEAARADHQRKLAEAEAQFEERLAAQRALWVVDQGGALGERIASGFEALNAEIGDAVGAILAPFVEQALRTRVVEELLRALEKVLKGGRPASLKISGPEDLLASIRQALGESASAVEFDATDSIDVRVVADRTVIETQLDAWIKRLSGQGG